MWKFREYKAEEMSNEMSSGLPNGMKAEAKLEITGCPRFETADEPPCRRVIEVFYTVGEYQDSIMVEGETHDEIVEEALKAVRSRGAKYAGCRELEVDK